MQEMPQVLSIDESGNATPAYDPSVTVPAGDVEPNFFDDPPANTVAPAESTPASNDGDDETSEGDPTSDDTPSPSGEDVGQTAPDEGAENAPGPSGVPVVQPTIVERYPHDGSAFTQGLEFADGVLVESLGLIGESSRRRVEPTSGEVTGSARLDDELFGGGLTVAGNQVIQLTWQQGVAVVADLTTLIELARFSYEGEGWGLCALDDGRLVMSNGSGFLTFRDPATFEPIGEIEISLDGGPVTNLNELECVGNMVYANVWLETDILEIDITNGDVLRVIDASSLVPGDLQPDDVLNGIAYRPETDTFFITGKRWTVMYEVSLA